MGLFRQTFTRLRARRAALAALPPWQAKLEHMYETWHQALGDEAWGFVALKWRLDVNDWGPGEIVRRPRSAGELADRYGAEIAAVRDLDARIVGVARPILDRIRRESDDGEETALLFEFMTVPVERAQTWWDERYASSFTPEGEVREPS